MELIVALVLFIGLIACWLLLPGSAASSAVLGATETVEDSGQSAAHVTA